MAHGLAADSRSMTACTSCASTPSLFEASLTSGSSCSFGSGSQSACATWNTCARPAGFGHGDEKKPALGITAGGILASGWVAPVCFSETDAVCFFLRRRSGLLLNGRALFLDARRHLVSHVLSEVWRGLRPRQQRKRRNQERKLGHAYPSATARRLYISRQGYDLTATTAEKGKGTPTAPSENASTAPSPR